MANRSFPFVISLAKQLQASSSRIGIIGTNTRCFSTAHQHTPQPQDDDPVRGYDRPVTISGSDDIANPVINVNYKTKEEARRSRDEDRNGGVTGFVADAAKQGTAKAAEVVENVANGAKETVHIAWDATKKTAENIRETTTAEADTNVVDTVEYRSIEDLKGQFGDGHNKKIELYFNQLLVVFKDCKYI